MRCEFIKRDMLFYIQGSLVLQNFITLIFIPQANLQGCDGRNHGCCVGSVWNETSQTCSPCMDGYVGLNCNKTCLYPKYGFRCQQTCQCDQTYCHVSTGCSFSQNADIANGTDSNRETRSVYHWPGSTTEFTKGVKHLKNNIISLSAVVVSSSLILVVIIYVICRALKSKGQNILRQPSEETENIPYSNEHHYSEIKEMNMLTQIEIKV